MANAFLLTYNPTLWDWVDRDEFLASVVRASRNGDVVPGTWSTGQRTRGIEPGDEVYLLRQGPEPRGIIASGTALTEVMQDDHWHERRGLANYIEVAWTKAVPADAPLPLADLDDAAPGQHWRPQGSGSSLRPEYVTVVESLWSAHVCV
ncbi:hypothetical protein [Aeromicrobium flavum]|uniref:hypothetical protein n=1 Tax=Aeromicrobium flavum TaxID=416568 RepID=UPI0031D55F0A